MGIRDPRQVRQGRDRTLSGQRLQEYDPALRPYFCRACGKEQRGTLVPRGWYTLNRNSGSVDIKATRLGVYCSVACLERQLSRLAGIERELGDNFDTVASDFRQ